VPQAFYFLFIFAELIAAIMFIAAMRAANARAAKNASAKVAGLMSFIAGCFGIIVMSTFVAKTPEVDAPHSRHLHWSFGLFTAAWSVAMVLAPLGWAA
jgi:uncharacterized membrane protein YdcZ (DUF606 family)